MKVTVKLSAPFNAIFAPLYGSRRGTGTRPDLFGRGRMAGGNGASPWLAMLRREGIEAGADGGKSAVVLLPHTGRLEDLLEGRVDAMSAYLTEEPLRLGRRGIEVSLLRPSDYGIDFYGDTLFTSEGMLAAEPELVESFRSASMRGWEYAMTHTEELADHIMSLPTGNANRMSRELVLDEAGVMQAMVMPTLVELGHMNPGRWERMAEEFVELGVVRDTTRVAGFWPDPRAAERKGPMPHDFVTVAGDPGEGDPFSGIDTTWNRIPGGAAVASVLEEADKAFDIRHTERILPALGKARALIAAIDHPWARMKLVELDELAAAAAGVAVDAVTSMWMFPPGSELQLQARVVGRGASSVSVDSLDIQGLAEQRIDTKNAPAGNNKPWTQTIKIPVPAAASPSQPYWLSLPQQGNLYAVPDLQQRGNPDTDPLLRVRFHLSVEGVPVEIIRPVVHRYIDPARGELWRPSLVVPPASIEFAERSLLFPSAAARTVEVSVHANTNQASGEVRPIAPRGWRVEPPAQSYSIARLGEQVTLSFHVTPPAAASVGELSIAGAHGMRTIAYDHIPPQTVFPPASLKIVRADVKSLAQRIGYIMGAGDDLPQALRQWGASVTVLSPGELAHGDLSHYDAIVTGVRAYNTRADLRANQDRLLEYVSKGGTMVVQYNVATGGPFGRESNELDRIGPYPLTVGRDRVAVEEAPLTPIQPDSPLLSAPNQIKPADYEGWVQERGLYFASKYDERYQALWQAHDPGEKPSQGATLWTRYGKGVYVFTPMSWFRQLPAGVPGAHRLFANIVSAGKLLAQ